MAAIYDTSRWDTVRARVLVRDGARCTVSRLLGGTCGGSLHVHHIEPVAEGGARFDLDNLTTVCARHHPMWEALRRELLRRRHRDEPRCRHRHRSAEARRICEARLARQRMLAA